MIQSKVSIHPKPILTLDDNGEPKFDAEGRAHFTFNTFNNYVSEIVGSMVFIVIFMLATEKKSKFSEDKVINCFVLAASYVAARLIAGGQMVTCFAHISKV